MFFAATWFAFESQFASITTLGIIYGVTRLITAVLEIPSGAIADYFGRKNTVIIGFILQAIGYITISQAYDNSFLWIGYTLVSIGFAFISGADTALNYDMLVHYKKEDLFANISSKIYIFTTLGVTFAIYTGSLMFGLNKSFPYIAVAISTLLAGFITFFSREYSLEKRTIDFKVYVELIKQSFAPLRKPELSILLLPYLLISIVSFVFIWFFVYVYLEEAVPVATDRGLWLAIAQVIIGLLIVKLSSTNKYTSLYTLEITIVLMGLGLIFSFFVSGPLAILTTCGIFFALNIKYSIGDQLINNQIPSNIRATTLSVINIFVSIVFLLTSFFGGNLVELIGIRRFMLISGIILFVIFTFYKRMQIPRRHLQN